MIYRDPLQDGHAPVFEVDDDDSEAEEEFMLDFKDFKKRYTRSSHRLWLRKMNCKKCWQCGKHTFFSVCVGKTCQEHHANQWFHEHGDVDRNGRRWRGGKSEVARARQRKGASGSTRGRGEPSNIEE